MIKTEPSEIAERAPRHWVTGSIVGLALVCVLSVLKVVFADALGGPVPFLLYFGAVFAAAWLSGTTAGLLTTLAATIAAFVLFIHPRYPTGAVELSVALRLVGFVAETITITLVTVRVHRERARARELSRQLQSVNTRLNVVVRGMSDGVTVQDRFGRLIYANTPAALISGFATPEELIAAHSEEILARFKVFDTTGNPLSLAALPSREALRSGQTADAIVGHSTADNPARRWTALTSNPLLDAKGDVEYVVNVFRDVTVAREHEEALRISREWFSTALRSIGDGVIATDEHEQITFMNPAAEALTRWPLELAKGRPLSSIFVLLDELTREPVESPVESALRGETRADANDHKRLRRNDGSEIIIENSAAPIRGGSGVLVGVVVVFRDVTAKRRAELGRTFLAEAAAAMEASLDYQTTLANVARLTVPTMANWCAIDMRDDRGGLRRLAVAHVDPAKLELIEEIERRYPPDPSERRGALRVLDTGQVEFIPHVSDEMLAHAAKDSEHLALITQLGLRSYLGVPLKRGGETIGVITLATAESQHQYDELDVQFALALAERASMAVDRAIIVRELQHANRAKDEFLAILGHELRNPLAPIHSALDVMNQRAGEALKRERLVIERQLKHVMRLVDDLLDVSRISGGKVELQRGRVTLAEVVTGAVEMVRTLVDERAIHVHLDVPSELTVNGDRTRLTQVVSNLLHNAAKYGRAGGGIWISAGREQDDIVLAVRDDGIGIVSDMLPRVFDLFAQESQALDRAKGGLGLGLAIVKSLVELHGGTIRAHSDGPNTGATFVLTLPASVGSSGAPLVTAAAPGTPEQPRRVLIVDDNEDALELLVMGIELLGHQVYSAPDGSAALLAVETHRPDIAFMDVGLPDISGYELAERIRRLDHTPRIRLVAVTGYGQASDRERAFKAGFDAHLVKPVSLEQIQQALGALNRDDAAPAGARTS